jgi:hypothetical protein
VTVLVWVTVLVGDDAVLVVVGVVFVAAVVADFVCAELVAVWSCEDCVSVLACVSVGLLPLALVMAPSARLEAVWLRLLATLAPPPEPHAANANMEKPNAPT